MESKNALAELAEGLDFTLKHTLGEGSYNGFPYVKKIRKAQRIVAELAKVKVVKVHSLKEKKIVEIDYPEREDANIAFLNCRAIAEEGMS